MTRKNANRLLYALSAITFVLSFVVLPSVFVGIAALFFALTTMTEFLDKKDEQQDA